MNPIQLYSQYFGKIVPYFFVAIFIYHFWVKYDECRDVMESLMYAAGKTP